MKKNLTWLTCFSLALVMALSSCNKEANILPAPEVAFSISTDTLYSKMNEPVKIIASVKGNVV
ncbi:MAG: hypothetical protein ABIN48_02355, partial [Ginsengibacter sp.]